MLPLWSHLQTTGPEELPSVYACADHLSRFLVGYTEEVSSPKGKLQSCECAIIGFDDYEQDVVGWAVTAVQTDRIEPKLRKLDLSPGAIEMLGSGADQAFKDLNEISQQSAGVWNREPLHMMRKNLRVDSGGDVGGGVQIGYVSEVGCQLMFDAQPVVQGQPLAQLRFRGFDYSEISTVGEAFCNMPGLA